MSAWAIGWWAVVGWAAEDAWEVDATHGPTHEVQIDVDEGTWVNVTVGRGRVVFDLLGDLWSVPLSGGVAKRLTEGPAWDTQPRLSPDGERIAFTSDRGGNENIWIANADGSDPEPFTDEEVARCTDPFWDPSGPYLLYRRRTVDTRSIGVTEIWQRHLRGGDGFPLTSLDDHPHANEPFATKDALWFSSRHGRFDYDESAVAGLWDLVRIDRETGEARVMVSGRGSASRPLVDPVRNVAYFVSRDRNKTLLEALDLATGTRRTVADWLSPDELEAFALHGTYPQMARTRDGDLVLWAQGKLWRLDPETGSRAEIPFRAQGAFTMADIARPRRTVPDRVDATIIRWPTLSSRGSWAYSALGALWVRSPDGATHRISEGSGFAPAWSPDGESLAWTSYDDETGGALHITDGRNNTATLPVTGLLTNPAFSDDGEELVVVKGGGGALPGTSLSRARGFEVVHLVKDKRTWKVAHTAPLDGQGGGDRKSHLRLRDGRIWSVGLRHEEPRKPPIAVVQSMALDGTDRREHLRLGEAESAVLSPDLSAVAFVRDHRVWLTALPPFAREVESDALPLVPVTRMGGDWVGFSPDGRSLTWVEGPTLATWPLDWDRELPDDELDDPLAPDPDIARIDTALSVPRARPEGAIVLTNARVLTMAGEGEVLEGVNIVIDRDRIARIGPGETQPGAREIDCTGKTVIPGLVDVHAHLHFTSSDIMPEQEWRYLTALDYGVTTLHDPSANTDIVFTQSQRNDAGYAIGPRVYSTGQILYGALGAFASDTKTPDDARRHVNRMATLGAGSVKVYQQSQRDRRQWYAIACREQGILCVPEGGGDLYMDLTMVVDGYHAIEHALPQTPLYADVAALFVGSLGGDGDGMGTFYTPTLQVAYGGLMGKNWFVQHDNPVDRARLRRHMPPRKIEELLWRWPVMAQDADWRYQSTARDAARLRDQGVHVTLGAHGELQGLGVHYELWALGGPGAMSPHDALAAATIEGARYLGLDAELGSIAPGKLADLVVLDRDPLADLRATEAIHLVLKNGVPVSDLPPAR